MKNVVNTYLNRVVNCGGSERKNRAGANRKPSVKSKMVEFNLKLVCFERLQINKPSLFCASKRLVVNKQRHGRLNDSSTLIPS